MMPVASQWSQIGLIGLFSRHLKNFDHAMHHHQHSENNKHHDTDGQPLFMAPA